MTLLASFHAAKLYIVDATGLARDTLHLHVGLALMLLVALLLRRSLGSIWPWLAVVLFATLGEFIDRGDSLAVGIPWDRAESLKDVLNTIFWPSALMILSRFTQFLRR